MLQMAELDGALYEMISVTLTPPSAQKKKRLRVIINQGSRILNTMVTFETKQSFQSKVANTVPQARIVDFFKRHVAVVKFSTAGLFLLFAILMLL